MPRLPVYSLLILSVAGCMEEPPPFAPMDGTGEAGELHGDDATQDLPSRLDGSDTAVTDVRELVETVGWDAIDGCAADADIVDWGGTDLGMDATDAQTPQDVAEAVPGDGFDLHEVCAPACEEKECGDDGCGGDCGPCTGGKLCNASSQCVCAAGRVDCQGTCCEKGEQCYQEAGECCTADCGGKQCGDDGCGESCGECTVPNEKCFDGQCLCLPDCKDKQCGDDGCGQSCGECDPGLVCANVKCAPYGAWAVQFESVGGAGAGTKLAVDAKGDCIVGGWFGWLDAMLAGTTLKATGLQDVLLAKVSAAGTPLWARAFGGDKEEETVSVALDAQGDVYAAGVFSSATLDLGEGTVQNIGTDSPDLFAMKLKATGQTIWARAYGGSLEDRVRAATLDAQGNLFLVGMFTSPSITFGAHTLNNSTAGGGISDVFLVKISPAGDVVWAESFQGSSADDALGIAVDKNGLIYVVGGFSSDAFYVNFLKNPKPLPYVGLFDIFVVVLDAWGKEVWSKSFGGAGDEIATGVVVDSAGRIVVLGALYGPTINFGGKLLKNAGGSDVTLLQLDGSGEHLWSFSFGGEKDDGATGLSLDGANNIYVSGVSLSAEPDLGAGPQPGAGMSDGFAMKLDSGGKILWTQTWGSPADESVWAISPVPDGGVLVSGEFWGETMNLGGLLMQNTGSPLLVGQDGKPYAPAFFLAKLVQ